MISVPPFPEEAVVREERAALARAVLLALLADISNDVTAGDIARFAVAITDTFLQELAK